MLLVFLFFVVTSAQSNCRPGSFATWTYNCSLLSASVCNSVYGWNINPATGNYIGQPAICVFSAYTGCQASSSECKPQCALDPGASTADARHKTGGPNGLVCSDFTTQSDCAKYYVDDYGDRWCFWKNGFCNTGVLCVS